MIRVKGIKLLSIEEYNAYRRNITPVGNWWWLRSQGYYKSFAAYVYPDGDLNEYGCPIYFTSGHIRPALVVGDAPSVGSHFYFGGVSWTVISSSLALADKTLGVMTLRNKNAYMHDRSSYTYVYETSELRSYLDAWLAAAIQKGVKR